MTPVPNSSTPRGSAAHAPAQGDAAAPGPAPGPAAGESIRHLHHPLEKLWPDYARAGAGLLLTITPLVLVNAAPVVFWVLLVAAGIFTAFALQTLRRHCTTVTFAPDWIETKGPGGRRVALSALTSVQLRYFTARKEARDGWMQLTLHDAKGKLTLDSTLDGFLEIAEGVAAHIREQRLAVNETTLSNFLALGHDVAPPKNREGSMGFLR